MSVVICSYVPDIEGGFTLWFVSNSNLEQSDPVDKSVSWSLPTKVRYESLFVPNFEMYTVESIDT